MTRQRESSLGCRPSGAGEDSSRPAADEPLDQSAVSGASWFRTAGGLPAEGLRELLEASLAEVDELPDELIGTVVGSVRIEAMLGRGGMGAVYRGFDLRLQRAVALKVLHATLSRSPEWRERFRTEARLLSAVEHPGICRVYDLIEGTDGDVLALELVPGRPLGQWLADDPPRDTRIRVVREVAEALGMAHERRIVHRDLKPDNVMVAADGGVKVLDFGIALSVPEDATRAAADFGGTLVYMSPEQARGEPIDAASDVFALGLLLQEVLTGEPAYAREPDAAEILRRVRRGETRTASGLEPDARNLVERLQSPLASRRPTAREAAAALRELEAAPLRRRRRRQQIALLAGTGLALVTAGLAVVHERLATARTAAAVQQLAREVEEIGWTMRVEQLAPHHDLSAARSGLLERMAGLDRQLPDLPGPARPPVESALGRALLELGEVEAARQRLDAAWEGGLRDGATRAARSRAYGLLYASQADAERAVRGVNAPLSPEVEALRQTAVATLAVAGSTAPADDLAALLALYEGSAAPGLAAVERWKHSHPTDWRALVLEAQLLRLSAADRFRAGAYREAAEIYQRARAAATAATAIGRSAPDAWLEACTSATYEARTRIRLLFAAADEQSLGPARDLCAAALAVAPWSAGVRTWATTVALLEVHGAADIAAAEGAARGAVERLSEHLASQPEDLTARRLLSAVQLALAERRLQAGGAVTDLVDAATRDRRWILAARPESEEAAVGLCEALGLAAIAAVTKGEADAAARVSAFRDEVVRASERFPQRTYFPAARLLAANLLGRLRYEDGGDCEQPFAEALELTRPAVREQDVAARLNSASAAIGLALCRQRDGRAAGAAAEEAAQLAAEATELSPSFAAAWLHLSSAALARAGDERQRGEDPSPWLERARAANRHAETLDPDSSSHALAERVEIDLLEAAASHDRDDVPRATRALARAAKQLAEVFADSPASASALRLRALQAAIEARATVATGGRATHALERASAAREAASRAGNGVGSLAAIDAELALARGGRNGFNPNERDR